MKRLQVSDLIRENPNKKKGLGRGLGSLLGNGPDSEGMASRNSADSVDIQTLSSSKGEASKPGQETPKSAGVSQTTSQPGAINTEGKVWQVAIDKLTSGQFQPRKHFEKDSLEQLAVSIKANGILSPIIARKVASGRLEIVAGERRWRAAQAAGLHEVPVLIKNFDDKETLELAIIENIQREDLNPIEEAEGYSRLITEFKLSQQQVAERVGRDRATVANAVRLLSLGVETKALLIEGVLSVGHAKVLLSLADAKKQYELAKRVVTEALSVRKLEKLVSESQRPSEPTETNQNIEQNVTQRLMSGLCDELQKILGTKVNIDYANSKGKIAVHFYSDDELTQIVDRLKQGWQK
jgi:ParB family chromosome partitioning protein